jgi:hypothetical protein
MWEPMGAAGFGPAPSVVVVVVVVFILNLVGLTTCSAMRGVPARALSSG